MARFIVLMLFAVASQLALGAVDGPVEAATFTVSSTGDAGDANPGDGLCDEGTGQCTLRAAIEEANAGPGLETIFFSIGSGVQTIMPGSPLPTLTSPVDIDATTQPGFAGTPLVELNGTSAGANANGLRITAGDSTVRGLAINRFSGSGILLETRGVNVIEANFIGTDVTGTNPLGNAGGVLISGSPANRVGGTTPGAGNVISGNLGDGVSIEGDVSTGNLVMSNLIGIDATGTELLGNVFNGVKISGGSLNIVGGALLGARNVISGNGENGILVAGSSTTGNRIQGNVIGTNVAGTGPLGNRWAGVHVSDSRNNVIGGAGEGARNLISGNGENGVFISGSSAAGNHVRGNLIGTDLTGAVAIGNSWAGVNISDGSNNTIGGPTPETSNLISGNSEYGVFITGGSASKNLVQGNLIGTDVTGTTALGNAWAGVRISGGPNNVVGGPGDATGNVIAFNAGPGVSILYERFNAIVRNSIFSNTGLGIDLDDDGPTTNDPDDADAGANNLQNFPGIWSVVIDPDGDLIIEYSVDSAPASSAYPLLIEFFKADADGEEGQTFVGSDGYLEGAAQSPATANLGNAAALGAGEGDLVVARATDAQGNTSEFSLPASPVGDPPPLLCLGLPVTIAGTGADDILVGSQGDDVMAGLGGDDTILGLEGNDIICAGPGADVVSGGPGADLIFGEGGGDVLLGSSGDDMLVGGEGADMMFGSDGSDLLTCGPGSDYADGGTGTDVASPSCETQVNIP